MISIKYRRVGTQLNCCQLMQEDPIDSRVGQPWVASSQTVNWLCSEPWTASIMKLLSKAMIQVYLVNSLYCAASLYAIIEYQCCIDLSWQQKNQKYQEELTLAADRRHTYIRIRKKRFFKLRAQSFCINKDIVIRITDATIEICVDQIFVAYFYNWILNAFWHKYIDRPN